MKIIIRTSFYLFLTTLCSILIIFVLYRRAYRINSADNGFVRVLPPHFITDFKVAKLPYDLCYIAGFTNSNIYLGKYQNPLTILKTDYNVSQIVSQTLNYDSTIKIAWTLVKVQIDSPDTYITEGLSPNIIHGNLNTRGNEQMAPDKYNFDICILFSEHSFISKRFDSKLNSNVLEKFVKGEGLKQSKNLKPFPEHSDMFTSDGMFDFDKKSDKIAFVYFHSNEFVFLDTNLNTINKGKTIDTIVHPNIKIGYIASEHLTTYATPPLVINRRSCITDRWLFVNSTLRANNQDKKEFSLSSTIDIYSLSDGKYLYSFYLPIYEGEEVIDFRVNNDKMIAIYHHYIVIYNMNLGN